MSCHLLTTRYGAEALDLLRDVVRDAKRHDPMAPVTVLVPNNLAGVAARRRLAAGLGVGGPGVAGVRISTLPRLAEELAAVGLTPRRPRTRTITAAAWRTALDDAPGVFEEVAAHTATVEALVRAHRELRDLDGQGLDAVAASGEIAQDLVRLHRRVVDDLSVGWYDETDLLLAAADLPDLPRRVRGSVVLHLPQVLTRAERKFVSALETEVEVTVVIGLTGVRRADGDVLASFDQDAELTRTVRPPTAHRVVSASDSDDEIRCIGRAVLADLADGVPAHRIAVLHGATEPCARLLHERFAAMDVTVNGPGVRAVADRAVARLLLELLDLTDRDPGDDLPRTELFRALAAAPLTDFTGERIPLPRWERASRRAGVVRGDDWDTRLGRSIDETEAAIRRLVSSDDRPSSRIDALEREKAAAVGLRAFALELRACLLHADTLTTWRDLTEWALGLVQALLPDMTRMPAEEQYAASAVIGTLSSLGALDDLEQRASLRTLRDVLRIELDAVPPRVGVFGNGVLVAPLSASVGLELDRVYVVGLAEDLYPGRLREDALLPDRVRRSALGQLPRIRRRLDDRHRALLVALQSAVRVTVSVPRGDLRRSTRRLPSRWLLPTFRELSGDHGLAMTDWEHRDYGGALQASTSFAGELLSTGALADAQEWRTRAIAAGQALADPVVDAGTALLRGRRSDAFTRFDGNLAGAEGLPDLLTADRAIAPTTLEGYARCPHTYLVQRLLGVRPLEQPEDIVTIRALDVGAFLHESLDELAKEERLHLPQAGQPWTPAQRARLQEIALAKAEAFESRGLTGHPRLWAVEREQLLHDLARILDDDDDVRAQRGSTVVASELEFGTDGSEPLDIPVPGGRIRVRGSADRVDRDADGALVVVDMKTGGDRDYGGIGDQDDPFVGATKLQLPVYAHAARARFGGEQVRAEYWFVRRGMKRIALPLSGIEADYAATLATLARSIRGGLFPSRPPQKADFAFVQCPDCNPDGIGHGEARERWERKRHDPALLDLVSLIEPGTVTA